MTTKTNYRAALMLLLTPVFVSLAAVTSSAQKANKLEIAHWREVLRSVERELKEAYYDPTFNGIDIEARFKTADAKMKNAESMADLERIVAQVLLDLDDTHTFFIPPDDGSSIEYGWRLKPVGDDQIIVLLSSGSVWVLIRRRRLPTSAQGCRSLRQPWEPPN